jgi:hypothetical protein
MDEARPEFRTQALPVLEEETDTITGASPSMSPLGSYRQATTDSNSTAPPVNDMNNNDTSPHPHPTPHSSTIYPQKAMYISPRALRNWEKIFRRLKQVTLWRRVTAGAYKIRGTPCERCLSMKLTESKFLIHEFPMHQRIERQTLQDRVNDDTLGPEGLEFGPNQFKLGNLPEIYLKSRKCAVCRLIVDSLGDQLEEFMRRKPGNTEKMFYDLDFSCSVSWHIDGRMLLRDKDDNIKSSRACTRRLRLRWSEPNWPDSFVVLMEKKSTTQTLFLARSLETFRTDAALVQRWLRFCDESHGDLCKPFTSTIPVSKSFFGVIDVKYMCLTKLPKDSRYVALSYTWGKKSVASFKTLNKNIKQRMELWGLNETHDVLPRTIKDAIRLVTDIGERYLWIDALCIIQDSDRSWALNSRVMDVVYGNAYFTICAADGIDSNAGLRALSGPNKPKGWQNIAFYSPEVRLKFVRPAEYYVQASRWNTRGWAFQERLLSPRNLIFANGRMFFQCRCTARSVDIITEDESAGWSIEFSESPTMMLQKLPQQPLLVYKQALQLYMKRELRFGKDILAAFTGIGNLICRALGGSLVYGLPSSHFDWALLWEFKDAATRRPQSIHEQFPSWSWCGWETQKMDFQYKQTMLAGVEENLHDWLMHHTWITWYIRDGNGNLHLVWDRHSGTIASTQVETTWRGYTMPALAREAELTYDRYGRLIKPNERTLQRDKDFKLILNECPFDVEIVEDTEAAPLNSTEKNMPFLQFFSWSAFFRIREDRRQKYKPDQTFCRYSIEDYKDDWCGTIMLDKTWVLKKFIKYEDHDPLEFVALSEAKQFADEEYDDWANYIPVERGESTWDLFYVLLIEYDDDTGIAYRVGLGKVYKEAFENSCKPEGKRWKEFILG